MRIYIHTYINRGLITKVTLFVCINVECISVKVLLYSVHIKWYFLPFSFFIVFFL